jgi:hypothetical protein
LLDGALWQQQLLLHGALLAVGDALREAPRHARADQAGTVALRL